MIKLIKSTFFHESDVKQKLISFIKSAKMLSFGVECEKFEGNFARWQGRKYCVMVNSGSSANLAIIQALLNLGLLTKGDRVGFSALTWSTNAMPLIELGLIPVPIDVELDTLNVSSRTFEEVNNKQPIKMLFLTNLLGWCDDIEKISSYCKKHKIILIEDNCESLGTVYKHVKLGNFGLASTFSFYVGHHMSTIEGGSICTDNEDLATMVKLVRAHGWDRNLNFMKQREMRDKFKVNSTFYSRYTFYDLGYNFRPTEINGFIGNLQVKYLNTIVRLRERNFKELAVPIYQKVSRYYPLKYSHLEVFSNFAIPVICKSPAMRDELVCKCANIVEIRPIVGGDMTKQPFFGKYVPGFVKTLGKSNAGLIHEQGLYFGNNPELTKKEKQKIIRVFTS